MTKTKDKDAVFSESDDDATLPVGLDNSTGNADAAPTKPPSKTKPVTTNAKEVTSVLKSSTSKDPKTVDSQRQQDAIKNTSQPQTVTMEDATIQQLDAQVARYLDRIKSTAASKKSKDVISSEVNEDLCKIHSVYKQVSLRARNTTPAPKLDTKIFTPITEALSKIASQQDAAACAMSAMAEQIKELQTRQPESYASAVSQASFPPLRPAKPAQRQVFSCVFKANDTKLTCNEAQELFKKNVGIRQLRVGVRKVSNLSNNTVKLDFDSDKERDTVMNAINATDALKAETSKKKNPLLILKGVQKDVPEAELIQAIIDQNPDVQDVINAGVLKIRFKRNNRQDHLQNFVLEASPGVRQALLQIGRISIDYAKVHVSDFSSFLQCYKCFGFGHTTKHCKSTEDACGHCSDAHKTSDCAKKKDIAATKCINCSKSNTANKTALPTSHSASSNKCPHVIKMSKRAKEMIDYGS